MFQGYLTHSGVEVFNSARTSAYVANMAPNLQMTSCWDDEDLGCALGHGEYRTPTLDGAPWFSESRPASSKFLGLYPLSVEGIEDSSRAMSVTELVEDGAIFSKPRRTSKEFRVRGLMMATDGEGLDAGMRWLRGALEAKDCTRCAGDQGVSACAGHDSSYLAYLPSCCDYSDYPNRPANWNYGSGGKGRWAAYGSGRVALASSGVRVTMPCGGDGAQWFVSDLIPGQTYRLRLAMRSPREMTVSVSGRETITAKRENTAGTLTRTPWVIDFVARGETEAIKVFQAEAGCYSSNAYITDLRVDRIAELSKVFEPRFSWTDFAEPQSWSWQFPTGTVPDTQILTGYEGDVERLYFGMENNGGSTITVDAGSGPQRIIRGLRPGSRYTVYVNAEVTGNITLVPHILGVADVYTPLGNNWYSLTFTAENPAHYIRLEAESDFTIPGTDLASIELHYLRVDLNVSSKQLGTPDQAGPARRELHGVELLNGPNVIQSYKTNAPATMVEVEFTMAVSRPYIYSELNVVPTTPRATTTLVSTGECANGEAVRYNLFTNPWFTNDSPNGGIDTYEAPSLGNVTISAHDDAIHVTPNSSNNFTYVQYRIKGNSPYLQAGHIYTISANIFIDSVQTGSLYSNARRIKVVDGITGLETGYQSAQAPNTVGKHRLTVRFVHTGHDMYIRLYHGGNNANAPVRFNSFLFEEGGASLDTFSGYTNQNTSWLGTPNQSVSEYRKLDPIAIQDPDCDPIPVAPQPPSIMPDCARDVDEWRRYWIEVPPDLAGGWAESVPVVALTTGAEAVRDVRIRFYPNTLGDDISALDPCSYCGEFYLSYVPPNAVFTIDSINKTAIADIEGTGAVRAMHLVSDINYGPIEWPEMSCDIPYYVTIDIAPDEVLDLNIDLAVALRE